MSIHRCTPVVALCFACAPSLRAAEAAVYHAQGEMAGEPTPTSVILQSRLAAADRPVDGDVPGSPGVARFEWSREPDFQNSKTTAWLAARPENDFIVKAKLDGLEPGVKYYYRLIYGPNRDETKRGPTREFKTLQGKSGLDPTRFVVVTGMNYARFHYVGRRAGKGVYQGDDKHLGYPALATILERGPDFFVGTGDNVYYDSKPTAKTQTELRKKWHEQFVQPRYVELFARVPTYWEKDDHDYRYNDCDTTGSRAPSHELGIRTFVEQVPVTMPDEKDARTYRTRRINRALQIWLVEGRDYRSPNDMPDGPKKSLWGAEQFAWLKRTLLESDAAFKILISPTPLVGPDDVYKRDNHTNPKGFRHEGEAFFAWLKENGFLKKNFYLVCGDRHWQYHSMHPSGFEEFSCGALVDANSRLGRKPGDPKSTDPDAKVKQFYTQAKPSGGFLEIAVTPEPKANRAVAHFTFRDERGKVLYEHEKTAAMSAAPARSTQ